MGIFSTLGILIGVPVIRSIAGWLENSLEDGLISSFEWAQLGGTIIRIGVIGLAGYFGLNGVGVEISALGASASAVVIDFILKAIKR